MRFSVICFEFLMVLIVNTSNDTFKNFTTLRPWRTDRRPKIMGDLIHLDHIIPHRTGIQQKIVNYHNYLRANVKPIASNMLKMQWHVEAAAAAQQWSNQCMGLMHDNITGRHIPAYGACGQNIFIATQKVPWQFAINTWHLEKDHFTYGSRNNSLLVVGHYTQMVWAASHQVGCGISKCLMKIANSTRVQTYYNYVCNYCPHGNRRTTLAKPYKTGKPCGNCPTNCQLNALCLNACPYADLWSNCKQLHKSWPKWLCDTKSAKGSKRMANCQATCKCKNKIYD